MSHRRQYPLLRLLNKQGVTLIEATLTLALFTVLLTVSLVVILNISQLTEKMAVRQELTENARLAIDAITTSVRLAESIKLELRNDGTLKKLNVCNLNVPKDADNERCLFFEYNISVKTSELVLQGTNELARYISRCEISIEGDVMHIIIETNTKIDDSNASIPAPITFIRDIDVRYKDECRDECTSECKCGCRNKK